MIENTFDFTSDNTGSLGPKPVPMDDFSAVFNQMNSETSDRMLSDNSRPVSFMDSLNAPVGPKTMTYAPDQTVDKFRSQEGFQNQYFNPLDTTNYQKWADKETFGSALSKGFDSFGHKFGNTFIDYWKGYGRMADALVHMDWDRMRPDEATLVEQYYNDQMDMNKNFVFEQPENEDSIFSKRTMSEFIGNAGFALGTFAGLGLEIAADIAITALSGGAGVVTFGATAARLGAKKAAEITAKTAAKSGYRFADTLADLGKGFSYGNRSAEELSAASKVINQIDDAARIANPTRTAARESLSETFNVFSNNLFNITKSKNFTELAGNLAKGTPLLGTGIRAGEKFAAASKAGANTAQLLGIGAQGLRRVAQELNMSATEASFEAVTSYGDTLDKMVEQYKAENQGAIPTAQEFEDMRKLAMNASSSNYNTNLALLLATNKLQFGNLFNKFIPAAKFGNELAENVLEIRAGKALLDKSGFFGVYGLTGKIAREFGKKEAAYQVGKAFAKDLLKFELSEGLQENLQETSGAAWKDYYAGQFNGAQMSLSDAFAEGASSQFSKQGLKTFLMGALTGSIIRLPTALATGSLNAANEAVVNKQYASDPKSNPLVLAKKQFEDDLRIQNVLLKQAHEGKFKDKMFNFAAQVDAAQEQSVAAAKGMRYEFENGRDNALLSAVASAQRTNSIDVLYRAVKDMGKEMTPEDFEKSFGVKLEDTKYSTPSEFSEAVAKDIKKYSETIEGLRIKMKSQMADPSMFAEGSSNRYVAAMMRNAQEDAIQILSMNAIKGDMAAKRARQVADDLRSVPAFASSSDFALRVLTNPGAIEGEQGNILGEIKILQESLMGEGLDANTKKDIEEQIELKVQENELINTWKTFWESRDTLLGLDKEGKPVMEKGLTNVFTGKRIEKKQVVKDENGNEIDTVDVTFNTADAEVVETFRKLLNIKNKQAKNNTEISEEAMRDGFQKIHDYIRLDLDTKDYMRSVDVFMNPENYKQMLQRMTDGKFKFQLINFVDNFINLHISKAYDLIDTLEVTNEFDQMDIFMSIQTAITESENYKNMLTLLSNPDTGIAQEEYALKLHDALVSEMTKKTAELTLKYGPKEETNDIKQDDFDEIISTSILGDAHKNLIAAKLSTGIKLSPNEQKVYDIHRAAIDKEVTVPVNNENKVIETPAVESPYNSADEPAQYEEETYIYIGPDGEEVVETKTPEPDIDSAKADIEIRRKEEYAKIDAKYSEQIEAWEKKRKENIERTGLAGDTRALDALKGLVYNAKQKVGEILNKELDELDTIEDKKEDIKNALDYILTGRYNGKAGRKRQSTEVGEKIAQKIATGLSNQGLIKQDGKLFSTLEGDNLGVAWSVGKYFAEEFKNGFEAELAALETPVQGVQASAETPVESDVAGTEQETAFAPVGTPEEGFDVVDRNSNVVNPEKFTSQEKAEDFAKSLNSTNADLEFVQKFLGPVSETVNTEMYDRMITSGVRSMKLYNKRQGTSIMSLTEYYNTLDGSRFLEAIRESLLTGKPVRYNKKKAAVTVAVPTTQIALFERPSEGRTASVTLGSLEDLYSKVVEFRNSTLQNPNKMIKFVGTETTAPNTVTESSILGKLQEITTCFS